MRNLRVVVQMPIEYRHAARRRCSTCTGTRHVFKLDRSAGFCRTCIVRSQVIVDGDRGGVR
jgi:Zn finger protein HypA/HybF involved in hydrogenase expression